MGLFSSLLIILLWTLHLFWTLYFVDVSLINGWIYLHILIQMHLTTGLFISAHDSIHGTVHNNKNINHLIGSICSFLYAFFPYRVLRKNHYAHHKYPGTENDPDFNIKTQNFFLWWGGFLVRYASWIQIIAFAIVFNILKIWFSGTSIWVFYFLPIFLSSLQLFYFGTFKPHKLPHYQLDNKHKARTQQKNHLWAFISCYFFGYHLEHHERPDIPWWKLHQSKI
ncbi:fatty acid desaturase [Bacteroidota bacterium]